MDKRKYLFEGSPLVQPVRMDILQRMAKAINDQEWPQCAIAGELFEDFTFNRLPNLILSSWGRDKRTAQLKLDKDDLQNFTEGYAAPLRSIDIAVRAYDLGELQAERYIVHRLKDETGYLMMHLTPLKNTFASDKTCADIFKYVADNPPRRWNDFCLLGIEAAQLEYGAYSILIMKRMRDQLGPNQTDRIWGFR